MATINPYIHFNGNAEEAFSFYRSVFGGEFARIVRYKELAGPQFPVPEDEAERIMHMSLPIGQLNYLMGSDTISMMGRVNEQDNRNAVSITAESKEEADHLFNGLSAGGKVEMPISISPWGSYFGMFADKYGVEWMVSFDPKEGL